MKNYNKGDKVFGCVVISILICFNLYLLDILTDEVRDVIIYSTIGVLIGFMISPFVYRILMSLCKRLFPNFFKDKQ